MKKLKKLAIKKVTLKNLDEPVLNSIAGGATQTCKATVCAFSWLETCPRNNTCRGPMCV
jgi:hypothetical protein